MNIVNYNHCFNVPNDILCECDCHKVYFEVSIDFETKTIAICKDWYNMRFKEELSKVNIDSFYKVIPSFRVKEIQRIIVNECVCELFGSYFPETNLEIGQRSKIGTIRVTICKRPYQIVHIDAITWLEYFNENQQLSLSVYDYYFKMKDMCFSYVQKYSKYKNVAMRIKQKVNETSFFDNELIVILFNALINKENATRKQ